MAKPMFTWIGSKEKLVPFILQLIPRFVKFFFDVFGGSGAVSLGIPSKSGMKVTYNDINSDLTNLMVCIKEKTNVLMRELGFLPFHSRRSFEWYRDFLNHKDVTLKNIYEEMEVLEDRTCFTQEQADELRPIFQRRLELFDVKRAAAYFLTICGSFNGTIHSFGAKALSMAKRLLRMEASARRLENIVIENKSAIQILKDKPRSDAVYYCDPPYFEAERFYDAMKPRKKQQGRRGREMSRQEAKRFRRFHLRLWQAICACPGYVILSYNDCEWVRELYRDFYIMALFRPNSMSRAKGAVYGELIITNYDPSPYLTQQLSMFEKKAAKWELRLIHIPQNPINAQRSQGGTQHAFSNRPHNQGSKPGTTC